MEIFINCLRKFVYLQKGLWTELCRGFPEGVDSLLFNVPKTGAIKFEGKVWVYTKHGLGVRFEEEQGKRKVDFHNAQIEDDNFDSWALSTYFGSLGKEGRKVLESMGIQSGALDSSLKVVLNRLKDEKVIQITTDGFYRFP